MRSLFLSILLISSLVGMGCTFQKSKNEESVLLRSYRLIDANRTEEAIVLLQSALEQAPKNREYRMALASAYAHYAGIKIQKLVPVVLAAENLSKAFGADSQKGKSNQIDSAVGSLLALLHQFGGVLSTYSSIPDLDPDKVIFVEQALNEIAFLGALEQNEAVYSGILRIVLIKNKISTNLLGPFTNQSPNECELDLDSLNQTVLSLGRDLVAAMSNFAIANPDQAEKISVWSGTVGSMVSEISIAFAGAMILDEVSNLAVRNTIIEEGFLKTLKCGMPR